MNGIRVLALTTYPDHAAATRFRVVQYAPLLAEHGVRLDVRPFLSNRAFATFYDRRRLAGTVAGIAAGMARRVADLAHLGRYDVAFVQREAAPVGPPVVEWLAQRRLPLVLDLDDPVYIERVSEIYGALAAAVKWSGKTTSLLQWATAVVCGNPAIAAHVERFGKPATVLPTIVDVASFTPPASRASGEPVLGWIGSHSTLRYLRTLIPALERVARLHRFRVRIVGGGAEAADVKIAGVEVEALPWVLEREIAHLQSFDLAVYPIVPDPWAEGKSGLKAIQYLSCGVPYVASPVGVVGQIGTPGRTHLEATSDDEWVAALSRLLGDAEAREAMGREGRRWAVEHYSTRAAAATLAGVLRGAASKRNSRP